MNKIKYFRELRKLTVRELSEKAKVATGYISALENDSSGKQNPTKDTMNKISEALDCTVAEVFFPEESVVS